MEVIPALRLGCMETFSFPMLPANIYLEMIHCHSENNLHNVYLESSLILAFGKRKYFDILNYFSVLAPSLTQRHFKQLDAFKRHLHIFLVIKTHLTGRDDDSQLWHDGLKILATPCFTFRTKLTRKTERFPATSFFL